MAAFEGMFACFSAMGNERLGGHTVSMFCLPEEVKAGRFVFIVFHSGKQLTGK